MQIGSLGTKGTATLGGTSQIQKSAKKTAENAITDDFVKQIQTLAREDAEKVIYMDTEFRQMRRARMEQYVSPDRAGPMSQVNSISPDFILFPSGAAIICFSSLAISKTSDKVVLSRK